jgi:hypothetical protein
MMSYLDLGLPVLFLVADGQRADVGDHGVETAERFGGFDHPGLERRAVGDVERPAEGPHAGLLDGLGGGDDVGFGPSAESDVGAFGGEKVHAGPADALGAAGHERPPAPQLKIHPCPPSSPVRAGEA